MKQSVNGDDPLSREIILFKKKREQADMIEQIFRTIKNNYSKTEISSMKAVIDRKLSQQNPIYNQVVANGYYARIKNDLSQKAFQSPEFVEDKIINNYNTEDTKLRAQAFARPISPATAAAGSIGKSPQISIPQETVGYQGSNH